MNRYRLAHPKTATVTFPDAQRAADFAFNFRNSPDFTGYTLHDTDTGNMFSVKNCEGINGIEFVHIGSRA